MRRTFALLGVGAGVWLLAAPWITLPRPLATHTMGGMSGGMMHGAQSATVAISASTYYWHLVPGALATLISLAVLMWANPAVARAAAVALGLLAIWSAAGPWVLPRFGMGEMVMSGVTTASVVRHLAPGMALAISAAGLFRGHRREGGASRKAAAGVGVS